MDNNNPIHYSDLVKPDTSISDLIKQLEQLSEQYKKTIADVKSQAISLTAEIRNANGATDAGREVIKKASAEADKLARAHRDLAFAESENAKKLAELKQATKEQNDINKLLVKINQSAEGSYNKLSAQYSLNKIYLNNMTKAERENTKEGRELEKQTKKIYEEMKRLQEATGKYQLNVGNYTNAIQDALGVNNQFGQSLLALGKGGDEAKTALQGMKDGAMALGKALLGLMTNPVFLAIAGLAGVGASIKWWYDYNMGIAEATRLTREFLNLSDTELVEVRSEIQSIADTYGKDFKVVLSTVDTLMVQFGISAREALAIIEDGFQSGADLSGNMLEQIQQFAPTFHDAGISASELVAMIQQTRSGIFTDKGMQVIEMASKRLREMSTATANALDNIGISSKQVAKDLADGTKSTFDIIKEISAKLKTLPKDSQVVGEVLKDVFGKQGAGAGIQLITQLDTMNIKLEQLKKTTGEYGQSVEDLRKSNEELSKSIANLFEVADLDTMTNKLKILVNDALRWVVEDLQKAKQNLSDLYYFVVNIPTYIVQAVDAMAKQIPILNKIVNLTSIINQLRVSRPDPNIGKRKRIGNWICEWNGTKWVGVERYQPKQTTTTTTTTTPTDTTKQTTSKTKATDATKAVEDAYKANLSAIRKAQDEALKLEENEWVRREQAIKYSYQRQIEDLQHNLQTQKNLTAEGRKAINDTIISLGKEQINDLEALEKEKQDKERALIIQSIQMRLSVVEQGTQEELKLRLQLLDEEERQELSNIKKTGKKQEDITALYEKKRIDTINAFAGIRKKNADTTRAQEIQAEIDHLNGLLDAVQEGTIKVDEESVKLIRERIKKLTEESKKIIAKSAKEIINSALGMLNGISVDFSDASNATQALTKNILALKDAFTGGDTQSKITAIAESFNLLTSALEQAAEAQVRQAEIAVQSAEKEVEAAQRKVEIEEQARANGYASNVQYAQKQLQMAKQTQEKALKDQRRAQKEQEAIQTIQQIGNLVSASALIWAQVGFPAAIPAIAIMWSSFAASKLIAASMAKPASAGSEQYGEGTVELLEGGSHQSGNDIDLGTKPNGVKRRAEGGEFFAVINKRNSRRYRKEIPQVINALNDGSFAQKYLTAYDGVNAVLNIDNGSHTDISELNDNVRAIRMQAERHVYTDGNGNMVTIYKNVKRTTK